MTIEEVYQGGGVKSYVCSGGESLLWVCRRLYGDDSELHRRSLEVLNPGMNWLSLGVGDVVYYLDSVLLEGAR